MEKDEFSRLLKGFNRQMLIKDRKTKTSNFHQIRGDIPSDLDWRNAGYVNPIQDQGQCGSCYAFSAVAAIEGQYFKTTGQLLKLSGI